MALSEPREEWKQIFNPVCKNDKENMHAAVNALKSHGIASAEVILVLI